MASPLLDWAFAPRRPGRCRSGTLDVPPAPARRQHRPSTTPATAASQAGAPVRAAPCSGRAGRRSGGATLDTVPASARTLWLLAGLAVALVGGALVRRTVLRRTAPTPAPVRRPKRSPARAARPATARRATSPRPPREAQLALTSSTRLVTPGRRRRHSGACAGAGRRAVRRRRRARSRRPAGTGLRHVPAPGPCRRRARPASGSAGSGSGTAVTEGMGSNGRSGGPAGGRGRRRRSRSARRRRASAAPRGSSTRAGR